MFPLILVIFAGIGAVAAIRRNPSYTTGSLLRSLPVIVLAIGVVAGLIVAAVRFTTGRSTGVIIATIVAVILFGCFFLIYVTYTVSTPKDARLSHTLPPGVKLVHLHRQKVYLWAKICAVLLAICGILRLLLPATPGFIALMLGAFILFIAVVLLPILYWTSRMMDVSLTALQADPWVHWVYTPEQWQQWSEIQVARLEATPSPFKPKRFLWMLTLVVAVIAAAVYLVAPGSLLFKTGYIAFITAVFILIGLGSARSEKSGPDRLRRRLAAATPGVYFGRDGLFANGAFTTWRSNDIFLNSAAVDDRAPRSLLFCFERDVPNPYGPLNVIPINQAVLIPTGKEHDLAILQQNLIERCPSAQIALA